jgi:hypothetical protein
VRHIQRTRNWDLLEADRLKKAVGLERADGAKPDFLDIGREIGIEGRGHLGLSLVLLGESNALHDRARHPYRRPYNGEGIVIALHNDFGFRHADFGRPLILAQILQPNIPHLDLHGFAGVQLYPN